MLKRAFLEDKLEEINWRIRYSGETEIDQDYRKLQLRLKKEYEKEYEKAKRRREPDIGVKVDRFPPRVEGYDGEQRQRGFFADNFKF